MPIIDGNKTAEDWKAEFELHLDILAEDLAAGKDTHWITKHGLTVKPYFVIRELLANYRGSRELLYLAAKERQTKHEHAEQTKDQSPKL